MKTLSIQSIVAVLSLAAVGCTTRMTEFTAISTKNLQMQGERATQRAHGESCYRYLGGLPIAFGDIKTAIDRAIESAGPGYDALEDGVISVETIPLIVYSSSCYVVTGTPVKTRTNAAPGAIPHSKVQDSGSAVDPVAVANACASLPAASRADCTATLAAR